METNTNNDFLATAPIGRLLLKLSLPTVAAQIINMLYNIVDRIYIGHISEIGELALTGLGVCLPVILIVSAFAALVSASGASLASIAMGKKDNDAAEEIMGNCFYLQVIVSLVLTVLLLIFGDMLLPIFGASANTMPYASAYLRIYALGTLFVQVTLGMNSYITAQGFASVGMKTVLIGAVSNIILDPIFIFVFDMGVKGAALATIISQGISFVWVIKFLTGEKTVLKIRKKYAKIKWSVVSPCLALGIAPFIMQASESFISVCFNSSLLKYGGDLAVGAMTILSSVMQFAMLPMQGFAQGAQPITGYNYGAKNKQRVKQTFKYLLLVSLTYAIVLWLLIMLCPKIFAAMFTSSSELIEFASKALRVYCGAVFMFGIQISCQMTFVALGNAKASALVAVVRKFVLLLPLIYIMPNILSDKVMAVYSAEPVADIIAVIFTAVLFSIQFKKSLKNMDEINTI